MGRLRKSSISQTESPFGHHRFEHWYRDNSIYFITARCRDRFPAFESDEAKAIFWDRLIHYAKHYDIVLLIVSLMNNHYHLLAYVKRGENLGPFMQHVHGSVAKLVNDVLESERSSRLLPFWYDSGKQGYFDGCLRDETQHRRTHRYIWLQCVRHRICADPKNYPHTREFVTVERAINRALELGAYMKGVPYKRYEH